MSASALWFILAGIILKVTLLFAVLILPGYCILRWFANERIDQDQAFLLSVPVTIVLLGLIFAALFSLNAPVWAHQIIYWVVIITAGALAVGSKVRNDILELSSACKTGLLFAFLSVLISVCFIATGYADPTHAIRGWEDIAWRNPLHTMLMDNGFQYYSGLIFVNHFDIHVFDSCSGGLIVTVSDRPPLMGILYAIELLATGSSYAPSYWDYEILGIVLNSLYLIPLYLLLARLFPDRRMVSWISAAVILNGFVFFNTWYTAPKLMSAYFALIALYYVLSCNDFSWRNAFVTGICCGLAAFSHGGAALSLPCLALYQGVALWRRDKSIRRVFVIGGLIATFVAAFLIVQLPWEIYKARYVPERNFHLKIHYFSNTTVHYASAKDIDPDSVVTNGRKLLIDMCSGDKLITTTPLNDWIREFFQSTTLREQIQHRLYNLAVSLNYNGFPELFSTILSGEWNSYFTSDHESVFSFQLPAVGPLNIVFGVLFLITFFIRKRIGNYSGRNTLTVDMPRLLILLSFAIVSIVFNILLKWTETINQELPYLEMVLGIALTAGLAFSLHLVVRIMLMAFIGLRFFHYVYYATVAHGYSPFDFFFVAMTIAVIAVMLIPVWPVRRPSPQATAGQNQP